MEKATKGEEERKLTCEDVADYFVALANESGESMTNLKLQKLVYYAQAWYLANEKKPLFDEEFQAWVHGPVIPKLYHEYKEFGSGPIVKELEFATVKKRLGESVSSFLDDVAEIYMPHGAFYLERMTHEEMPWVEARVGCEATDKCTKVISKDSMQMFYGERIKDSTDKA